MATWRSDLSNALRQLGDLADAAIHYERALAVDEAVFEVGHPKVLTTATT